MKAPDAGTTMVIGAAIGSILGVTEQNISLYMAVGAATGALIGGTAMLLSRLIKDRENRS